MLTVVKSWAGRAQLKASLSCICSVRVLLTQSAWGTQPAWVNSMLAPSPLWECRCFYLCLCKRDKLEGKPELTRSMKKPACRHLNEAADSWADASASGFLYMYGIVEMEEGEAIMAAYPVWKFSISVFPGSLPSPAWISLLIIQTADFLKTVPIWFRLPPSLLLGRVWREALPSACT